MLPKVYISCDWRSEMQLLLKLRGALDLAGYETTFQSSDIGLDTDATGIEGSLAMVACLSRSYDASEVCRLELERAKNAKIPIIPVLVDPEFDPEENNMISNITTGSIIDFTDSSNFQTSFDQMIQMLTNSLHGVDVPELGTENQGNAKEEEENSGVEIANNDDYEVVGEDEDGDDKDDWNDGKEMLKDSDVEETENPMKPEVEKGDEEEKEDAVEICRLLGELNAGGSEDDKNTSNDQRGDEESGKAAEEANGNSETIDKNDGAHEESEYKEGEDTVHAEPTEPGPFGGIEVHECPYPEEEATAAGGNNPDYDKGEDDDTKDHDPTTVEDALFYDTTMHGSWMDEGEETEKHQGSENVPYGGYEQILVGDHEQFHNADQVLLPDMGQYYVTNEKNQIHGFHCGDPNQWVSLSGIQFHCGEWEQKQGEFGKQQTDVDGKDIGIIPKLDVRQDGDEAGEYEKE